MEYGKCLKRVNDLYGGSPVEEALPPFAEADPMPGPEGGDLSLFECTAYDHCTYLCGVVTVNGAYNVLAANGECVEEPVRRLVDGLENI